MRDKYPVGSLRFGPSEHNDLITGHAACRTLEARVMETIIQEILVPIWEMRFLKSR